MDRFFSVKNCERCGNSLESGRIMCWFTDMTICMDCSKKQSDLKKQMREAGMNPSHYEGCGYIPKIKTTTEIYSSGCTDDL